MKLPRFRIAWAMVFVAIAALNLGAIRAWSNIVSTTTKTLNRGPTAPAGSDRDRFMDTLIRADLLGTGALPMGNILAVNLMIHRRRRNRPFLLGFEAFGATALTVYVAAASYATYDQLWLYLEVLDLLGKSFGPPPTIAYSAVVYLILAAMLVPPQLAFALIGGLIFRRFRAVGRPAQDPR